MDMVSAIVADDASKTERNSLFLLELKTMSHRAAVRVLTSIGTAADTRMGKWSGSWINACLDLPSNGTAAAQRAAASSGTAPTPSSTASPGPLLPIMTKVLPHGDLGWFRLDLGFGPADSGQCL